MDHYLETHRWTRDEKVMNSRREGNEHVQVVTMRSVKDAGRQDTILSPPGAGQ